MEHDDSQREREARAAEEGASSQERAAGTAAQAGKEGLPAAAQRAADPAGSAAVSAAGRGLTDPLRSAEISALYHKAREGFLETCHRFSMLLVLVSSSGAVYALTQDARHAPLLALIPAIVGALDIAFGFTANARDHAVLARRFLDLAADASTRSSDSEEFGARFYRLCGEEPPIYEALLALCHNHVCDAMGQPTYRQKVPFRYVLFRHLVRFSGKRFEVEGDTARGRAVG